MLEVRPASHLRGEKNSSPGTLAALFLYDYLLTLDLEVEYFWRTRTTRATILFFANRYTNILVSVLNIGIQLVEAKKNTFVSPSTPAATRFPPVVTTPCPPCRRE